MAKREKFQQSTNERSRRRFSEEFKKRKVREIDQKLTRISEVSRAYQVRQSAVRLWVKKYSINYAPQERLIVESKSETKKLLVLQTKIAELERLLGQKQVQLDYKDKMIELAEEHYGIDIKKKFESKPLSGSGKTEKD